jgi:uncharacterized lipoprotein YddW (UPF0748 family)
MAHKIYSIALLACSLFFLYSCNNSPALVGAEKEEEKEFWVWSHPHANYSNHQWDSVLTKLSESGFKGILMSADTAVLNRIIPIAKSKDIEVHAWMWAMNRGDADSSWWSYNANGKSLAEKQAYVGYYKFMCPALPAVKEFLKEKVKDLAKINGLDGIHLDYIRYVDVILPTALQPIYGLKQDSIMAEFDYGYHPYMRNLYKEKYGIDPKELPNFKQDTSWINFRLRELNKTVNTLVPIAHKANMQLTAAVFPSPQMSRNMVRQDWEHWNLDKFFPMVYYKFYNEDYHWAASIMDTNIRAVGVDRTICGLYTPDVSDSTEFANALESIFEKGAKGISLFELNGLKEFHYDVIKRYNTFEFN